MWWRRCFLAVLVVFLLAISLDQAGLFSPGEPGAPPRPGSADEPLAAAAPASSPPPAAPPRPAPPPLLTAGGPAPAQEPAPAAPPGAARPRILLAPRVEGAEVTVRLRPIDGEGREVLAKVAEDGTAAVPAEDLPDGTYEVEVTAVKAGVLVRTKDVLRVGEGTADLAAADMTPRAGVRARVVDADGTPVPQASIVVVRPEEEPERGRRVPTGEGGWVMVADLEPGVDHRLVVYGLPEPFEQVVRVPHEPKGLAEVEVHRPERLAAAPLDLPDPPPPTVRVRLRDGAHEWDQALPLRLLPGAYEVRLSTGDWLPLDVR